jgi:hypothetical protein
MHSLIPRTGNGNDRSPPGMTRTLALWKDVEDYHSQLVLPTCKEKYVINVPTDFQCNPRGSTQQDVRSVALTIAPSSITSSGWIVVSVPLRMYQVRYLR